MRGIFLRCVQTESKANFHLVLFCVKLTTRPFVLSVFINLDSLLEVLLDQMVQILIFKKGISVPQCCFWGVGVQSVHAGLCGSLGLMSELTRNSVSFYFPSSLLFSFVTVHL